MTDTNPLPHNVAPLQTPVPQADIDKKNAEALAMVDKQDKEIAEKTGGEPTQPDYVLPEKFKDVNALIKSYAELEKKLKEPNNPPEKTAEPTPKQEPEQNIIDKYTKKYFENNNALDETDYAELKKAGYDKNIIDTYIQGKIHESQQYEKQVLDGLADNTEHYQTMLEWGKQNYSDQELQTFNSLVTSGDINTARMAIENLKNRYNANNKAPNSTVTGTGGSVTGVFNSWAEVTQAMQDPRYTKDPAYNKQIQQKLFASGNLS